MHANRFDKLKISIRYWLLGRGFTRSLEAMEFAMERSTGFRKDGVTPEFQHQLEIVSHLRTLPLLEPERTITVMFLHDVVEDHGVRIEEIESRFGKDVSWPVWLLSKEVDGLKKPADRYFKEIGGCPVASIGKGVDRVNNMGSMVGAFTLAGQQHYLREVRDHFFPMLKRARRIFPGQEAAYENVKLVLENQVRLVEAIHRLEPGIKG